ncbi:MAG: hypothetical protein IPL65_15915 [Lewinellaceae bacterium]|nr:hypothetical protein [Lewinellaceae bacterium]
MKYSLYLCLLFTATALSGQSLWTEVAEPSLSPLGEKRIFPDQYRVLEMDIPAMEAILALAPERFSDEAANANIILEIPMPDGRLAHFRIEESSVMAPALQAKYPDIRCYTGRGIEDRYARLKCDLTPQGFHALVHSAVSGTYYIDPLSYGDRRYYQSYFKKNFSGWYKEAFECGVEEPINEDKTLEIVADRAGDCKLRLWMLALACTGEYAQYHGGTVSSVLAAMNTSMNRVNGVFENDAGITMSLVANNDQIIYLNASSDPYTNGNGSAMLGQNQTTCDNVIGSANYDIGHVFSTGGGGVAYLGCVCNNGNKAGGVTGSSNPVGDPFDIDYVAHEMGHQYSGRHTQNNSCNRDNTSSHEPGSASTIMGYAGICSPDVQSNSDDYYSAKGLEQFGSFTVGSGNSCATILNTSNGAPSAGAGSNYTIPKSTPYILTATGSDPNGDPITFCWEQMNTQVGSMPPASGNSQGPMFRSLDPTPDPQRYMPNLDAVIANSIPTWEVLSSVGRTLNFRVTVRDNGVYGCTTEGNMVLTVSGSAGPFLVTAPNTNVTWQAGTSQTVTWNPAGTTGSPINTANVMISLSTDGGYTYPTVLLASTPNDGSQAITVPAIASSSCRVKVEAIGNIYYDISNVNFTIDATLPVELTDFSARMDRKDAMLEWNTETESNNSHFEVEMLRQDAQQVFVTAGKVAGKGTSTTPTHYSFRVPAIAPGDYLFRLRQVDFGGAYTLSPVRTLHVANDLPIAVVPNPAYAQIEIQNLDGRFHTLTLYDINGREVLRQSVPLGATSMQIPLDGISRGPVQGILLGDNGNKSFRFVKM